MPDAVDSFDATVLLGVLAQVRSGDFSARMPLDWTGVAGKVADGLNEVVIANQALGAELSGSAEWSASRASCPSGWCSAAGPSAGRGASSRSTA